MFDLLRLCFGLLVRLFHSRASLLIENLAPRQQLAVFKRKHSRPIRAALDKSFWVALRRFWCSWKKALIVVTPDTVVRRHQASFQLYWRLLSRPRKQLGRRPLSKEIRELIFQMVAENPTWRVPRIHGELVMVGFEVSERSVARWMRRAPRGPDSAQRWLTFLRNHREALAAMDFFSVPTITFVTASLSWDTTGRCAHCPSPADAKLRLFAPSLSWLLILVGATADFFTDRCVKTARLKFWR